MFAPQFPSEVPIHCDPIAGAKHGRCRVKRHRPTLAIRRVQYVIVCAKAPRAQEHATTFDRRRVPSRLKPKAPPDESESRLFVYEVNRSSDDPRHISISRIRHHGQTSARKIPHTPARPPGKSATNPVTRCGSRKDQTFAVNPVQGLTGQRNDVSIDAEHSSRMRPRSHQNRTRSPDFRSVRSMSVTFTCASLSNSRHR